MTINGYDGPQTSAGYSSNMSQSDLKRLHQQQVAARDEMLRRVHTREAGEQIMGRLGGVSTPPFTEAHDAVGVLMAQAERLRKESYSLRAEGERLAIRAGGAFAHASGLEQEAAALEVDARRLHEVKQPQDVKACDAEPCTNAGLYQETQNHKHPS